MRVHKPDGVYTVTPARFPLLSNRMVILLLGACFPSGRAARPAPANGDGRAPRSAPARRSGRAAAGARGARSAAKAASRKAGGRGGVLAATAAGADEDSEEEEEVGKEGEEEEEGGGAAPSMAAGAEGPDPVQAAAAAAAVGGAADGDAGAEANDGMAGPQEAAPKRVREKAAGRTRASGGRKGKAGEKVPPALAAPASGAVAPSPRVLLPDSTSPAAAVQGTRTGKKKRAAAAGGAAAPVASPGPAAAPSPGPAGTAAVAVVSCLYVPFQIPLICSSPDCSDSLPLLTLQSHSLHVHSLACPSCSALVARPFSFS